MADAERPDKLDELVIAERRKNVAGLYLNRVSQTVIAEQLGCSQQTVSADLQALKAEWKAEHKADIDAIVTRELAELDIVEGQAAQQFASTHAVEWLHVRLKTKERRSRLLGLDQPTRADVTSGGMPLPTLSEIVVELPRLDEEPEPLPPATAAPEEDAGADEPVPWPTLREVVVELPE